MNHYTYILECADHTLYTGWTNDLGKRLKAHNSGKGAKYTRPASRRPVRFVYTETFDTKEAAMKREAEIKKMTRQKKEQLISRSQESQDGLRSDCNGCDPSTPR